MPSIVAAMTGDMTLTARIPRWSRVLR